MEICVSKGRLLNEIGSRMLGMGLTMKAEKLVLINSSHFHVKVP